MALPSSPAAHLTGPGSHTLLVREILGRLRMVATHVQDQMEIKETELWRLGVGMVDGLRQQTGEIIKFHSMQDANKEEETEVEEIKTGTR